MVSYFLYLLIVLFYCKNFKAKCQLNKKFKYIAKNTILILLLRNILLEFEAFLRLIRRFCKG